MLEDFHCVYCDKNFHVDIVDASGGSEETTFDIVKCPYCKKENAIFYRISIDWYTRKPEENELVDCESIEGIK